MPIERYSKGTGYTKRDYWLVTRLTRNDFEEAPRKLGDTFEGRLNSFEKVAKEVLKYAGLRTDAPSEELSKIASKLKYQSDEWYACETLRRVRIIRKMRERADKREEDWLLTNILDLGSHIREWKIKLRMREAVSYRTDSKNQVQKGEARRQAFEAARKRGLGTMAAYRAAAKELSITKKISWKTIQRAVKDKSD
jgi:hypothetical protein